MSDVPEISALSLEEFFRDAVVDAMSRERVSVEPYTEHYVIQLLVRETRDGHHPMETLSDEYVRALSARTADRRRLFQSIGDRALVFSGFWWNYEFRPRRLSNAEFHLQLGRRAYGHIGGQPFDEMALKFDRLADALARLATNAFLVTPRDIARLYRLWDETYSRYAARALAERGLAPMKSTSRTPS